MAYESECEMYEDMQRDAEPWRWRNTVDRDVITLNPDGVTGTSCRTGQVSAENMRIVRSSAFWEPIP